MAIDFQWIPAGSFVRQEEMGQMRGQSRDKAVPRKVVVKEGFWMATYETTQDIWQRVMNPSGQKLLSEDRLRPVAEISWNDCRQFIAQLTPPTDGWCYDLPTEDQWEHACRAGSKAEYYGPPEKIAWLDANAEGTTHRVGMLQNNAWGLYDMHGNVAEWCDDACGEKAGERVIRGGSWDSDWNAQASVRNSDVPSLRINRVGFRLVLRRSMP